MSMGVDAPELVLCSRSTAASERTAREGKQMQAGVVITLHLHRHPDQTLPLTANNHPSSTNMFR